jgi:nucleotide-binding universal stress UspA family protein
MYNAHLHVLHVVKDSSLPTLAPGNDGADGISDVKRGQYEERLEKFVTRWLPHQTKVVCEVRVGQPHKEIIEYTRQEGIDLIVIATHGRTGLNHLMMGSVAEKVMRLSPVPVLAVKPRRVSILTDNETTDGEIVSEAGTHEHRY